MILKNKSMDSNSKKKENPIYFLNNDCIISIKDEIPIISNPRLRIHIEPDISLIVILLQNSKGLHKEEWKENLKNHKAKNRTNRLIGSNGLVGDHSGFSKKLSTRLYSGEQLFDLLVDEAILIKEKKDAEMRCSKLDSLFDQKNLGTFHERVGQYVLLGLKEKEPWRAWQNQKFTKNGKELIGNNYKQIQKPFFDNFFKNKNINGLSILDFGCGNGYFSNKLADLGANVTAMDMSKELLNLGIKNYKKNTSKLNFLLVSDINNTISTLKKIKRNSVDIIYLQDTLLLLMNPENGLKNKDLHKLISTFKEILSDDGEIFAMEPNAIFWLSSRYGDDAKPFTIITEYRNQVFNVVPTIGEFISLFSNAGFGLSSLCHPPHTDNKHEDFAYINEFPVWDFMTFKKLK